MRAERNFVRVELAFGENDPLKWSFEEHKRLELFLRYKTTAERAFSRAHGMLESFRRARSNEETRRTMADLTGQRIKLQMQIAIAREEREAAAAAAAAAPVKPSSLTRVWLNEPKDEPLRGPEWVKRKVQEWQELLDMWRPIED